LKKLRSFNDWLGRQHARYRLVIPGNHDSKLEDLLKEVNEQDDSNIGSGSSTNARSGQLDEILSNGTLLINRCITIDGNVLILSIFTRYVCRYVCMYVCMYVIMCMTIYVCMYVCV
jgi:hypothetical protein